MLARCQSNTCGPSASSTTNLLNVLFRQILAQSTMVLHSHFMCPLLLSVCLSLMVSGAYGFHSPKPLLKTTQRYVKNPTKPVLEIQYEQRKEEYSGLFRISNAKEEDPCSGTSTSAGTPSSVSDQALLSLLDDIQKLKSYLHTANEIDPVPDDVVEVVASLWAHMETTLNDLFGSESNFTKDPSLVQLANTLRGELRPLLARGPINDRWISKPEGYAGDYLTIEWLYANIPQPDLTKGSLGHVLDQHSLGLAGTFAVQNRRKLLAEVIKNLLEETSREDSRAHVTSMACGPAREIQDALLEHPDAPVDFQLIDLDKEALGFVESWRDDLTSSSSNVNLHQRNLILLAAGKEQLDLPPQDLIYSMGLIDYFSDRTVIRLLNYMHDNLRPGGKVMLGQFHKRNPTRGFMDSVLDWKLIHRDEEDMKDLFRRSKFEKATVEISYDTTKVQMLVSCQKEERFL